jgi:hypothetical protein
MWHTFLALPLVVRVIAWSALGVAALIAAIKAKALHAAWSAVCNWFWGWVSKNVSSHPSRPNTNVDLRLVAGSSIHSHWSIGAAPISKQPMMILVFTMNFAHVEPISVHIKRAYLKGTKEMFPMPEIVVEGPYDQQAASVCIGLSPVKAKPGKDLTGKIVFVDQFNGKHVSEELTFYPNTLPHEMLVKQLEKNPNCFFCNRPVEISDQAQEAQLTAHIGCIWP